ncbi:GDP-mannose-dependent alpha-(1-6)-phosphatidylinositol monomannoside mannosyltransferase [subsurface metagenome]
MMPGAVLRDEVPLYFRTADIFVVPSVRHESGAVDGLPVVVPEAMAAGLPVVASDVGGIPVLIKNRKNGILIRERDTAGIAGALTELLQNPSLRAEYGEKSRRIIAHSVNYDSIAEYFLTLYREIAQKKTPMGNMPVFRIEGG